MRSTSQLVRYVLLGIVVVLEGLAVLSAVLHIAFLPFPTIYPSLDSALVVVLPLLVGALTERLEVAILLTVAPFLVLAIIYATIYSPVWQIDLVQLGVLASRVTGMLYLLGGLGLIGWLLRRAFGLPTSVTIRAR